MSIYLAISLLMEFLLSEWLKTGAVLGSEAFRIRSSFWELNRRDTWDNLYNLHLARYKTYPYQEQPWAIHSSCV